MKIWIAMNNDCPVGVASSQEEAQRLAEEESENFRTQHFCEKGPYAHVRGPFDLNTRGDNKFISTMLAFLIFCLVACGVFGIWLASLLIFKG
jgi:hypothetical protein